MNTEAEPAKRVLLITVRADIGGGPEHVLQLIENAPSFIDYHVTCPEETPYWERYTRILGENKVFRIPRRKFSPAALIELVQLVRTSHIDLIHSHGKGAGMYGRPLALLSRKPCIHTFHGLHIGQYGAMAKIAYLSLERILSRLTAKLIAVSEGERHDLISHRIAEKQKIVTIVNGVNIPESPGALHNTSSGPARIVSITRYNFQKNSDIVIDIAARLHEISPQLHFCIQLIGTGEQMHDIQTRAAEQGLAQFIEFTGPSLHPRQYLRQACCYLSTSRWEGLPLAVIEAMSEGLPVVASDVVGNRDVVQHGKTGYLFNISTPAQASEQLAKLLTDEHLRETMGHNARQIAQTHFDIKRMVTETIVQYRNALTAKENGLT